MLSFAQKSVLFIGLALYALLGSSPFAPHVMTAEMMDSHAEMMTMGAHDMSMGDCADGVCVQAASKNDCLEHCFQSAVAQTTDKTILTTVSLLIAIVAAAVVVVPAVERIQLYRRRYWFRPLYLFNTVRLLE